MGFAMPHITIVIAGAMVGLALLLQIVGVATNSWLTGHIWIIDKGFWGDPVEALLYRTDTAYGLWQACGGDECVAYPDPPGWMYACRAFGIVAVTFGMALMICFMSDRKSFFFRAAPIILGLGAFCALLEFAVFIGANADMTSRLDYSFYLTVVACILCIVATVLFCVGRSRSQ